MFSASWTTQLRSLSHTTFQAQQANNLWQITLGHWFPIVTSTTERGSTSWQPKKWLVSRAQHTHAWDYFINRFKTKLSLRPLKIIIHGQSIAIDLNVLALKTSPKTWLGGFSLNFIIPKIIIGRYQIINHPNLGQKISLGGRGRAFL